MSKCDCFSGTPGDKHYQPAGTINKLYDFDVYQVKAQGALGSKGEILVLPDAFGLAKHNIILADQLASQGYNVNVLDYYHGNALPEVIMDYVPGTDLDNNNQFTEEEKNTIRGVDVARWSQETNPERIHTLVVPFIEQFKESLRAMDKLHVVGHCFGGQQAFKLATSGLLTSIVIMHPAPFVLKDAKDFHVPLFIGLAENDLFAPSAAQDITKGMIGAGVYYKIAIYGGTQHGFASRADPKDELARKAYTSSISDTLAWIGQFTV